MLTLVSDDRLSPTPAPFPDTQPLSPLVKGPKSARHQAGFRGYTLAKALGRALPLTSVRSGH